jgi:hypothetical protein
MYAMSGRAQPRPTLAPEDFRRCGRTILGPGWRRQLAAQLGLDEEMVNDWAEGRAPVPYVIVKTLASLGRFRGEELLRISDRLTADLDTWLNGA